MKVFYDLTQSPYIAKFKNISFVFSSNFYKEKFEMKLQSFINSETSKLYAQYNTFLRIKDLELFFAIVLYKRIEKRGLRIINSEGKDYIEYSNGFSTGGGVNWNI